MKIRYICERKCNLLDTIQIMVREELGEFLDSRNLNI